MRRHWVMKALKIAAFVVVAVGVFGAVVMLLWNWLMPAVFGWHVITFWQAVGILILSKILFGGFRPHPGHRGRWKRRLWERWERMTPEEREKFRQGMRERWCAPDLRAEGTRDPRHA